MLQLQRQAGNQAVLAMLRTGALQAKLQVGSVDDPLEHEADRVADHVMRMPDPALTLQPPPQVSRKCAACEEEDNAKILQTKPAAPADSAAGEAPSIVHDVLASSGQPLDPATRSFFESRFGQDFRDVRIHTSTDAAESVQRVGALAYTVGSQIVFGRGQFVPNSAAGQRLFAHELAHVVQQRTGQQALQRRAANCPAAPPSPATITTTADFIALVQRVEASTPTGNDPIATARLISRTKYEGPSWDWLLPTTKGKPGVVAGGKVTADDIGSLCFKLIVSMPDGGMEDPMHVIAAIVAEAETLPAGTGATGLSRLVDPLPTSVSQRGVSTWVGDIGKAAAEWMAAFPLPAGGTTKADYMQDSAPPHDLMADVDGVAMTSKSVVSGFAFDKTKPLSDNLQRFFMPAKGKGRERRFHIFCNVEGFALEADGVTLTTAAKTTIGKQVKDFAAWFDANDPSLFKWNYSALLGGSALEATQIRRVNDWQWFADQFIDFAQKNLTAEGP